MEQVMYNVIGQQAGREPELLDTFDTQDEAERMAIEYRMAFGTSWYIYTNQEIIHDSEP